MKLLHEIQQTIKAPKTQYNKHGKYKYRSCSDILSAVKPFLKDSGAFLHMTDELVEIGGRHYVKATVTLCHEGKTLESVGYAREPAEQTGMHAGQLSCSTSSYARKLALSGLFGIDDSHDAGNSNGDEKPTDLEGLLKQAHFNYATEHGDSIPEGFTCDYEAFKTALRAAAKKGKTINELKNFAWTAESIKPFIEKLTLKQTLVQNNADTPDN